MTMNSSGPISLAGTTAGQSIEIENGGNGTTQISLNDAAVRSLAGVPSGAITMPTNFYGKSNRVALTVTFTTNTANAATNVSALGGYVSGKSDVTITVNSGVYLYSTSTAGYGYNLTGGTTGDTITLVNNGYICGMGGLGGAYNGGAALNVGTGISITVNNTNASAYIGGGGGGGANSGGGGAGGGAGGPIVNTFPASGGAGGAPGAVGGNGGTGGGCCCCAGSGGGGGRIFPGSGGAAGGRGGGGIGGGAGGGGGGYAAGPTGSAGGTGGGSNSGGGSSLFGGGGGGGWGATGGTWTAGPVSGGSGGKAVNLNGKTVTWVSGNTTRVWGSVA